MPVFWKPKIHQNAILIAIICFGAYLRFDRIEYKVFWQDEVYSAIRVSGRATHDVIEWGKTLIDGPTLTAKDLLALQQLDKEHGFRDILTSSLSNPHCPIYYIVLRAWALLFGDSVTALRSFSAFISVLTLVALFAWCRREFTDQRIAPLAVALFAVSPFQVLYAQETRMYSLLTLLVILSSLTLQRALEDNCLCRRIAYGIALTLGLLTHILFVLVLVSHVAFLVIQALRTRSINMRLCNPLLTIAVAGTISAPWLWRLLTSNILETHETAVAIDPQVLVHSWANLVTRFISDLHLHYEAASYLVPFSVGIVIAGIVVFRFAEPVKTRDLILALLLIPLLAVVIPDLIRGGSRSTVIRYLTPFGVALNVVLSYLVAFLVASTHKWRERLGWSLVAALLCVGIASNLKNRSWEIGNKTAFGTKDLPQVISELGSVQSPHIVTSLDLVPLLSLAHNLNPHTKIRFVSETAFETKVCSSTSEPHTDIFYLAPRAIGTHVVQPMLTNAMPLLGDSTELQLWKIQC